MNTHTGRLSEFSPWIHLDSLCFWDIEGCLWRFDRSECLIGSGACRGAPASQKLNLAQLLSSDAGGIFLRQPLRWGLPARKRMTPTEMNWKNVASVRLPVPVWTHATGRKLINLFVISCVSLENQPFQKKGPSNRRNGWNTIQSLSPKCSPTWRTQCYAEPAGSGLMVWFHWNI